MRRLLLIPLIFFTTFTSAADKFAEFQSAGLIGLGHASFGLQFKDHHALSVGVGYVPELADHDDMTLLSVKYRYISDKQYHLNIFGNEVIWVPYSFSITALRGKDNDIYKSLPDDIPNGYYAPTARRVIFSMQTNFKLRDDVEIYWDWSMLEVGLVNYIRNFDFYRRNYDFLGLDGVVSYGVGFRVRL